MEVRSPSPMSVAQQSYEDVLAINSFIRDEKELQTFKKTYQNRLSNYSPKERNDYLRGLLIEIYAPTLSPETLKYIYLMINKETFQSRDDDKSYTLLQSVCDEPSTSIQDLEIIAKYILGFEKVGFFEESYYLSLFKAGITVEDTFDMLYQIIPRLDQDKIFISWEKAFAHFFDVLSTAQPEIWSNDKPRNLVKDLLLQMIEAGGEIRRIEMQLLLALHGEEFKAAGAASGDDCSLFAPGQNSLEEMRQNPGYRKIILELHRLFQNMQINHSTWQMLVSLGRKLHQPGLLRDFVYGPNYNANDSELCRLLASNKQAINSLLCIQLMAEREEKIKKYFQQEIYNKLHQLVEMDSGHLLTPNHTQEQCRIFNTLVAIHNHLINSPDDIKSAVLFFDEALVISTAIGLQEWLRRKHNPFHSDLKFLEKISSFNAWPIAVNLYKNYLRQLANANNVTVPQEIKEFAQSRLHGMELMRTKVAHQEEQMVAVETPKSRWSSLWRHRSGNPKEEGTVLLEKTRQPGFRSGYGTT